MTGSPQSQDPVQQVPWPSLEPPEDQSATKPSSNDNAAEQTAGSSSLGVPEFDQMLSTWRLVALSISMLGVQVAWTLELAYGTPYLLSLGVSDQITSLVWLAGPLSGLVAQPLAGALSDASSSRFRRRVWVVGSSAVLVLSALLLAFSANVAKFILFFLGYDLHDHKQIQTLEITLAIFAFYLFDFAINGAQASLRNLLLDVTPQEQLSVANAWQARMLHAGSIFGNALGFLNLSKVPVLNLVGGDQFRKFCILAIVILVITVSITCMTQNEKGKRLVVRRGSGGGNNLLQAISNIGDALVRLPRPIRRICYVQLFSWIGWFPFLFYTTAYVGQVMALEQGGDPDNNHVTRTGEFALFLYSLVAVTCGTVVPHLASRDRRLLEPDDPDKDEEALRCQELVWSWREEASKQGKAVRLPRMPFMLRNIWTTSLVAFTLLMFSTFFIREVLSATIMIALCGFCWAIACWVPFAIIMEYLKEIEVQTSTKYSIRGRPPHGRSISTPSMRHRNRIPASGEAQPLLRRNSISEGMDISPEDDLSTIEKPLAGGTVLGIHNLAIVIPQFIVSIVSSLIFKIANKNAPPDTIYYGKSGVSWALRFGGVCALIGAALSRKVPPTRTERQMRRRIAYMKASNQPA